VGIAIVRDEGVLAAGVAARGDFVCTDCGYGVWVTRALPVCPMCRAETWRAWPPGAGVPEPRLSLR
jgi:hypothetical protein